MSFEAQSITLAGKFRVQQPAHEAFPLFSPRGEEAWVPNWKPEILYPAGAEWERGLVFRTMRDGQETVWFVGELDREQHRVRYYRVDLGIAAVTVDVACDALSDDETEVRVQYTYVALTDAGNDFVRSRNQEDFDEWMRGWEASISA